MTSEPLRIAMWSGPRNMSTTMMRSFGARADTVCVDEPFYAAYLHLTGLRHPMSDEIFAAQSSDPEDVAADMTSCPDPQARVFYQKHMTHHMVPAVPRDWMQACRNVFLIRHPARVIPSYARKMETVSLDAIGFPQQLSLFEEAKRLEGRTPVVVDSTDILRDPPGIMAALCTELGLDWSEDMLSWPEGARPEDGVWAPHWYDAVWNSTGFGPAPGERVEVQPELAGIYAEALDIYERLAEHRLVKG
ncbi:MAG: HAD family hydrolase [Hyphomonadaceae bacterium]|nr:HAD family hydrolase [Hyphomonadaceae bacterium]